MLSLNNFGSYYSCALWRTGQSSIQRDWTVQKDRVPPFLNRFSMKHIISNSKFSVQDIGLSIEGSGGQRAEVSCFACPTTPSANHLGNS